MSSGSGIYCGCLKDLECSLVVRGLGLLHEYMGTRMVAQML